ARGTRISRDRGGPSVAHAPSARRLRRALQGPRLIPIPRRWKHRDHERTASNGSPDASSSAGRTGSSPGWTRAASESAPETIFRHAPVHPDSGRVPAGLLRARSPSLSDAVLSHGAPDRPGGGGSASRRRQDAARLEQLCLPTPEGPAQIDEVTGDRARLAGGSKHGPEHVELRRQGRVLRVWVKEEDHA